MTAGGKKKKLTWAEDCAKHKRIKRRTNRCFSTSCRINENEVVRARIQKYGCDFHLNPEVQDALYKDR